MTVTHKRPEYIQIEAHEDVPSVRDRLSFIRGQRVLMIWPEEGTALTRKLDLVLVQREARRRAVQLAIVTHDPQVIDHARDLNISTFETIGASERTRWKRGRTRAFLPRHHKPEDNPDPEELMPIASRVRSSRKGMSRAWQLTMKMLALGALGGVIVAFVFVLLPSATVYVRVEQQMIAVDTQIIADPTALDVDVENGVIPATVLQAPVQTVQQIQTTGIQQTQDNRAVGVVNITNTTTQRINVPIGTQVSTANGIMFATTVNESIPAGAEREIAIEALPAYSGTVGNVAEGRINTIIGDLRDDLRVINRRSTIGGAQRTERFVTEDDRERLLLMVRGQLQSLAYSAMESQILDEQVIVIESINIPASGIRNDWIDYSHDVGDQTDVLSLSMRAVVEGLALDNRVAQQIVFARLSAQKPADLVLQTETFAYQRGQVIPSADVIQLQASGSGIAVARVDEEDLQRALRGLSVGEGRALIRQQVNLAEGHEPQITVTPSWLGRLPVLPFRIQLQIETGDADS